MLEVGDGALRSNNDKRPVNTAQFANRGYPRGGDTCGDRCGDTSNGVKDTSVRVPVNAGSRLRRSRILIEEFPSKGQKAPVFVRSAAKNEDCRAVARRGRRRARQHIRSALRTTTRQASQSISFVRSAALHGNHLKQTLIPTRRIKG